MSRVRFPPGAPYCPDVTRLRNSTARSSGLLTTVFLVSSHRSPCRKCKRFAEPWLPGADRDRSKACSLGGLRLLLGVSEIGRHNICKSHPVIRPATAACARPFGKERWIVPHQQTHGGVRMQYVRTLICSSWTALLLTQSVLAQTSNPMPTPSPTPMNNMPMSAPGSPVAPVASMASSSGPAPATTTTFRPFGHRRGQNGENGRLRDRLRNRLHRGS